MYEPCSPVGLKEAALDTPTFRATTVHFSDQVEVIERWLAEFVKAAGRLANEVNCKLRDSSSMGGSHRSITKFSLCIALEELVNGFLVRSTPPVNLSEAVLDHDYTLQLIRCFAEGAREYWTHTVTVVKRMEAMILDPIRTFMQGELRNFKVRLPEWDA